MNDLMKVRDLIAALAEKNPDAPVMIAVIKYPEEFSVRFKDGVPSWADSTDVECIPWDAGEVTTSHDGVVMIAVELAVYSEQRHVAGG